MALRDAFMYIVWLAAFQGFPAYILTRGNWIQTTFPVIFENDYVAAWAGVDDFRTQFAGFTWTCMAGIFALVIPTFQILVANFST